MAVVVVEANRPMWSTKRRTLTWMTRTNTAEIDSTISRQCSMRHSSYWTHFAADDDGERAGGAGDDAGDDVDTCAVVVAVETVCPILALSVWSSWMIKELVFAQMHLEALVAAAAVVVAAVDVADSCSI